MSVAKKKSPVSKAVNKLDMFAIEITQPRSALELVRNVAVVTGIGMASQYAITKGVNEGSKWVKKLKAKK